MTRVPWCDGNPGTALIGRQLYEVTRPVDTNSRMTVWEQEKAWLATKLVKPGNDNAPA